MVAERTRAILRDPDAREEPGEPLHQVRPDDLELGILGFFKNEPDVLIPAEAIEWNSSKVDTEGFGILGRPGFNTLH